MNPIYLYYACSAAGLFMIVGGIVLVYTEKIFIDRETRQPIVIETKVGTFTTNVPALVLFALGFFPLIMPIVLLNKIHDPNLEVRQVIVTGEIQGDVLPVTVFAVMKSQTVTPPGRYQFTFPVLPSYEHQLYFVAPTRSNPPQFINKTQTLILDEKAPVAEYDAQKMDFTGNKGGQ
jgi:hypothetical protein